MPQTTTLYRVLIASPSDVKKERSIIPEVIAAWNATFIDEYDAVLHPVLWETSVYPEMGERPQAIVNKQIVDRCDILVGVFWTRLGTPTGVAESGTVEEVDEFLNSGRPVMLYFSQEPVALQSIDTEQLESVKQFKAKCMGQGIVSEYETIHELREKITHDLSRAMQVLQDNAGAKPSDTEMGAVENHLVTLRSFVSEFGRFYRRLDSEWQAERDSEPLSIDEGKYILERACDDLLDYKSDVAQDRDGKLSKLLGEVIQELKALQQHQVYIDGGISYRQFWQDGTVTIDKIKDAVGLLESALAKSEVP